MGDKLTSIAQQLAEQTSRALTYNEQSPVTNATIANPVADATLAFDGTTGAIKAGASIGDIANAAANATAAAASAATASAASTAAQAANGGIGRVARLATAGNVTLSGLQTIDGVVGADGDRIFVRGQSTAAQNGIYIMASGAWTRATDANTWSSFVGMLCTITEGSARKNHVYISLVTQGGTLGTTPITFDTVPIDGHITTIKIADANVTLAKIANVGSGVVLGRSTAGSGVLEELTTLPAVNGSNLTNLNGANIATGNIAAARITNALNASGSAPLYACRAWVNFNGTGTVAIRASGNVSSITDNGVGDYTVNFTTAMPTANYAAIATTGDQGPIIYNAVAATAQTVNLVRFRCFTTVAALVDTTQNHVAVFC